MKATSMDDGQVADAPDAAERTHFGFETVSGVEKRNRVMGVFSSVAGKY